MTNTITTRIKNVDAEPMLDTEAMALIFGVDPAAVLALPTVDGTSRIPREWVRRGRRRAKEAQAHTGSDFILDALHYWARKDHGATLEVVYE
ncbi:hypothetical protein [Mycolicibacterium sp. CR10]|uniref:hypothetical protein n=1 Tax=Mycolicibacterium sp. CR10 TaxID=2562314 RepID=UPI0010C0C443|nr:hypothetical protein [Mycolicibacterium sp. CR10]